MKTVNFHTPTVWTCSAASAVQARSIENAPNKIAAKKAAAKTSTIKDAILLFNLNVDLKKGNKKLK